jgi:uncharacterized protein (TIGR02757 family)
MRASDGLKARLDALYASFNVDDAPADPVHVLRRFPEPADREVVAFLAASLAFGRVASVLASIDRLLATIGPSPAAFVRNFDPARHGALVAPLVHRWTRGPDLSALFLVMREMVQTGRSIEGFFARGHDLSAPDITAGLESFSDRACRVDVSEAYGGKVPVRPGVRYFFPRPSAGSGCKRLNLFLRWMVRQDAIDPGGWTAITPAQLIVPLDTHVIRVGRCLGLTRYASPGWKMAAEITASLRRLDPVDPVRYDFALCHVGMMGACRFGQTRRDIACPLRGQCLAGRSPIGDRRSADHKN